MRRRSACRPDIFSVKSIYELKAPEDSADLIVCCEVMEHLEQPEAALETLQGSSPITSSSACRASRCGGR